MCIYGGKGYTPAVLVWRPSFRRASSGLTLRFAVAAGAAETEAAAAAVGLGLAACT